MPIDELPKKYGGNNAEYSIPELKSIKELKAEEQSEHQRDIKVARGEFHEEKVFLKKVNLHFLDLSFSCCKGSTLWYEFSSKGYDIAFSVRKEEEDPPTEVEKVSSHKSLQTGYVDAVEDSTWVVRFDNTYSWTRGKHVKYRLFINLVEIPLKVHS